ncbi:origin recognition complex, subunit 6 [Podospora aff. communis PSN243]|uniref:Origin recognition complex, subunit 6 n=1 Tax=Podospora aff. communis PSN243 TaxID=3040156 RepID=A0AAV9GU64_9PEZI|nr:origin recognition complex, subunit 6 [Podospora aff. communis PSN243]
MNRPTEQALLSLLPTHNSALPKPLIDLASSLLAQSRHRATILKAEEEIARPYACAHIACDRLKITLNLPPITPQPPIPPRIYKRLYTHLDKILTASTPSRSTPTTSRIRTPSTKLRTDTTTGAGASPLAHKSRGTPSKEKSLAQFRSLGPGTPSKSRSTTTKPAPPADPFPPWVRPVIRHLCSTLGPSRIGPVVMSGLESIVAPHGQRTEDVWTNANLTSLLGAVYMCVWRGVVFYHKEIDANMYGKGQARLLQELRRARKEVEVKAREGEDEWEGWQSVKAKDLDTAMLRMNRHGWLEMDWVAGIKDLGSLEGVGEEEEDEEEGKGEEGAGLGQVRRSDTMMQERYDYLSEKRRKEYAVWKEEILKRIRELERDTPPEKSDGDAMDLDD